MRKLLLCLAALALSSCGDDLGWDEKVKNTDADCYDSTTTVDSGVCNLCQDATEMDVESDTVSNPEDVTVTDSVGDSSDDGINDIDNSGDSGSVPDSEGDVTETTDTGTEDVVPPPECVTATDCAADQNPCTDSSCEAGKCVQLANSGTCTDDNECTDADLCENGTCVPGKPVNCDDTDPCTDDSCNPQASCVHMANSATCTDDNVCTVSDVCKEGTCKPGEIQTCDDKNPCTDDSCDKVKGCVNLPNTVTCTDGNACTLDDVCKSGSCDGVKAICDDGQLCTDDSCDPTVGCVNLANAVTCSDGDDCTLDDKCAEGKCKSGDLMVCPGKECIISSCEKGKCVDDTSILNDVPCKDGNLCTTLAKCLDGKCLQVSDKDCNDANVCTADSCDPTKGCDNKALSSVDCTDGNACTSGDICQSGVCIAGGPTSCDDQNLCTDDSCDQVKGCVFTPVPDDTSCKVGICKAGKCECPSGFGCAAPKFSYTNDSNAGMIGGMGGGVGPKMGCADTDVLIGLGFDFSNGTKTATRTTAVCGKVTVAPNGTVSTQQTSTQKSGGSGCFGWDPSVETPLTICPPGWAVVGLKALKPGSTLFNSVTVVCGQLGTSGKWNGQKQDLVVPGMPGTGGQQEITCPPDSIARYFETRAGCGQDALTMYCAVPTPNCDGQDLICKDVL